MADDAHTRIGEPAARVDGRLKVTGKARYPSDEPLHNVAYGYLVTSSIARGRIKAFHLEAARAVPGFLDILTYENTQGEVKTPPTTDTASTLTIETSEIQHDGQLIGLVVADSYEAAREAAHKVVVDYEELPPSAGFDSPGVTVQERMAFKPTAKYPAKGDAAAAFAAAPVKIDARYETPTQHQNPMELYTTTCEWTDGKLTIYEPSTFVYGRKFIASNFGLKVEDVRVVSRFIGGAFGGKASGTARTVMVALAAKRLGRPVKLMPTRAQGFRIVTYRAETRHHVQLAANPDGRIQAYMHEGWELSSRPSTYNVNGVQTTALFYNYANVATKVSVVHADRNTPGFMRSPAETPYMYALESGMDELAYALKMDPVELRRVNDTQVDPISGRPFSSRSLMKCFDAASEAFGWSKRNPEPRSMRDGDWLVGYGCASTCYPSNVGASAARVSLTAQGTAKVQVAFAEIGNGAYTIVAQTAADKLGLPIGKVTVELGDTDLPPGNLAAGSNGTASTTNAVAAVCEQIRARIAEAAVKADGPFHGADPATLSLGGRGLVGPGGAEPLSKAVGRLGGTVEVLGGYAFHEIAPGALQRLAEGNPAFGGGSGGKTYVSYAHGAQFVEVRVHSLTGEVRVPRMVGAYAAGTIVNRRTASSQLMGAQIWGLGCALHEATEVDPRAARYTNDNIADYLIAVNADVNQTQVILVPEEESHLNPLGVKGLGELGNVGMNAAVANAVYHATGRRIRKLPIRIEDLI